MRDMRNSDSELQAQGRLSLLERVEAEIASLAGSLAELAEGLRVTGPKPVNADHVYAARGLREAERLLREALIHTDGAQDRLYGAEVERVRGHALPMSHRLPPGKLGDPIGLEANRHERAGFPRTAQPVKGDGYPR